LIETKIRISAELGKCLTRVGKVVEQYAVMATATSAKTQSHCRNRPSISFVFLMENP
jgi:hypothetical protein